MFVKDSIIIGIFWGLVVPFVTYAIWLSVFDWLDQQGAASGVGMTENFRNRTTSLLAVSCNMIPFQFFSKRNFYNTMRGIIFPTVMLAMAWFFYYGQHII